MRVTSVKYLAIASLFVSSLTAASTPPSLSTVSSSPESPLGPQYLGGMAGQATVSAGGNAVYQLPIELPPGVGESTPNLRLVYNSNVDNGLLGLGWFLQGSDSKITRCPQNMAQDGQKRVVTYNYDDRFCLNGNRLVLVSGSYGYAGSEYRTESDQFARVTAHGTAGNGPAYFTVETKSGHLQYFGHTSDSAVEQNTGAHPYLWRLNRHEDQVGNYYTIQYHENTSLGESYPVKIEYSGNAIAGVVPNNTIDLVYESRSDNPLKYQRNSVIHSHPKRLKTIGVKQAGIEIYRYELAYQMTSSVNPESRLATVTRCEQSSCQVPISIAWNSAGATSYSATTMNTLTNTTYSGSVWNDTPKDYKVPRWHDLNGDGRDDYLLWNPTRANTKEFHVLLTQPDGSYVQETWSTSVSLTYYYKVHFADVDGDGRTDLVYPTNSNNATFYVLFSRNGGFVAENYGTHARENRQLLRDMNGDHRLDLVTIKETYSSNRLRYAVRVHLNNGSSFGAGQLWITNAESHVDISDFDGDGLADAMVDSRLFARNNGAGFDSYLSWGAAATGYTAYRRYISYYNLYIDPYKAYHLQFRDFNGDGLMDRKTTNSSGSWVIHLNTGRYFKTSSPPVEHRVTGYNFNGDALPDALVMSTTSQGKSDLDIKHSKDVGAQNTQNSVLLNFENYGALFHGAMDKDGDGFLDYSAKNTSICRYEYATNTGNWLIQHCETQTSKIFTNTTERTNLVSSITEPSGRVINFEYDYLASGNNYTKGTGAVLPELDIQDSTRVVDRLLISDGIGGDFETTYEYEGLKWNLNGRGILGFAKIISTNADTGIETTTEYEQSFPLVMQPKHVEQRRVSDGRLLAETDTTYTVNGTVGSGPVFPYVSTNVEKQYALSDGRLLVTKTTNRSVDAYGNTTSLDVETNDAENGEVRKQVANNTYNAPDLTNWRVGQLANSATQFWLNGGMSSADTRTTSYTYGSTYGLLKTTTREPGGGAGIELTTTRTHDSFGNVLTETVSGPGLTSRTTTITYDTRGQFPLTLTNALGHTITQAWDPIWGKKTSETDANGQTTTWAYDSFGHQTGVTRPDGTTVSTLTYEDPLGSGVGAAFYQEILETGKAPRRTFVDMLGRTVRERSQSFDGSYVNVDSEYDSQGRLLRQSEPYFDSSGIDWNTFSYDDIGRVTALTAADPVASSTTSYNGFTTTVTDSASRSETQVVDAAGRVISVTDKAGTPMTINYDAQGNRASVTAAAGTGVASTVTYTYDRYGRLTQQNDPDHGIYSYTYDALGNKLTEVSPKMAIASQTRSFTYDLLGRLTSRSEPEGTANWTYDDTTSGNLGIGKLHQEYQSSFSKTYSYASGNYGRVTAIATQIGSAVYHETKSYDANGMLSAETYPAGVAGMGYGVEYTYNALGYLERVQDSGGTNVFYQTVDTNAAGRITEEWMGDGSTVTNTFDGVSARITGQLSQATSTIQQFSYSYDSSGNMLSRTDNLNSLAETFSYDNLDRLTSAQVTGQSAVSYAFDEMGSITQKSDVADTYDYIMGPTHAVTLLTQGSTTNTLSYDANGNMAMGSNEPTVTWSSYNKPTQLTKGGITYDFSYGTDRRRYKKQRNTQTTLYIGNRHEVETGSSNKTRSTIFANGRAIMVREDQTGGTTYKYLHRDHLDSVTAITDGSTGNVLDRLSYDAWGQRRIAATWIAGTVTATDHRGYTGHEHLDDIGVIHMNGRIYSPSLGRMLSPDPVTQSPNNGQNYDRYTYAFNNPLKHTDPSGYQSVTCGFFGCGIGFGFGSGGTGEGGNSGFGPYGISVPPFSGLSSHGAKANENRDYDSLDGNLDFIFGIASGASEAMRNYAGDVLTNDGVILEMTLVLADAVDTVGDALIVFDIINTLVSPTPDTAIIGVALKGASKKMIKNAALDQAKRLGFKKRIPAQKAPFDSHGQAVFQNGNKYITYDVDAHNGGFWKVMVKKGGKFRRDGTYDFNLEKKIKEK